MSVSKSPPRSQRGDDTRSVLLATAERLFALHGVTAVSNRQICEMAGQANNSVIAYHFGGRAGLLRAIVQRHQADIEQRRDAMPDGGTLRDCVERLVRPITGHYAALGTPSWYARFAAQATTDPALREMVIEEVVALPSMRRVLDQIGQHMPGLPSHLQGQRTDMSRLLIVHLCAELEQSLADGTAGVTWEQTADSLADALLALWLAPATR